MIRHQYFSEFDSRIDTAVVVELIEQLSEPDHELLLSWLKCIPEQWRTELSACRWDGALKLYVTNLEYDGTLGLLLQKVEKKPKTVDE